MSRPLSLDTDKEPALSTEELLLAGFRKHMDVLDKLNPPSEPLDPMQPGPVRDAFCLHYQQAERYARALERHGIDHKAEAQTRRAKLLARVLRVA